MLGLGAWIVSAGLAYGPVMAGLERQWRTDPAYSHGWAILPLAAWLLWRRRSELAVTPMRSARTGLAVVVAGLALFVAGSLAAELFLIRVSLIPVLVGSVLYVAGQEWLRLAGFPLCFLLFAIPLPTIVFDRISVSLELLASGLGVWLMRAADVAVLQDGNVLRLANVTLQVTEACSGIRSLMTLLSIATLIAYLYERSQSKRAVIVFAAVPIAVVLNAVRVAGTAIAVAYFGPTAAEGARHDAIGWVAFALAVVCICALQRLLRSEADAVPRTIAEAA
jgi:exosortase